MNKDHLLALADALEQPLPKHFKWDFEVEIKEGDFCEEENVCGSIGCALGLQYVLNRDFERLSDELAIGALTCTPMVDTAAAEYFNIEPVAVDYLFYNPAPGKEWGDTTPQEVADRIREFVAEGGVMPGGDFSEQQARLHQSFKDTKP